MGNTLKRIILTLCIAIVLPIGIYVVYEVNTLTENEQQMKVIYERQLEAVLFSVNLYTEDIMNRAAFQLETKATDSTSIAYLFYEHPYFEAIAFLPMGQDSAQLEEEIFFQYPDEDREGWSMLFNELMTTQDSTIEKLDSYLSKGFRKLQPLTAISFANETYSTIGFVKARNQDKSFCMIVMNTNVFIEQVLQPKILQVGQEECDLLVRKKGGKEIISTNEINSDLLVTKSMWLLPDYEIGVTSSGKTLYEVIKQRTMLNIFSLGMLVLFIGLGVWLMFRSIKKAMEVAQNKSEFVSNVSHEIRTPLALISMFAETLSLGRVKSEERKTEYYRIIMKETARLTNLVNRILNFSQIEANNRQYQKENIDLNHITKEVLETYSYHLESKGFMLDFQPNSQTLPILADQEAVTESLVNLLENAMKYSLEDKSILVKSGDNATHCFIEVKDKGMGIPKEKIGQIFDKFYRIPQGDIHNTKGSGLGLSIVKHIIDAHNGEIEIESKEHEGSTFRLKFPKRDIEATY